MANGFFYNYKSFQQVYKSPEMQTMLRDEADRIADAANQAMPRHGFHNECFMAGVAQSPSRSVGRVYAANPLGVRKKQSLLTALFGGR